jgi:hypothetical protein
LLYLRKREEARMADALDEQRILNVAIVDTPSIPSLPTGNRLQYALIGLLLASTLSVGVVFTIEYLDPSLRTPSEVMSELNIPVLAAVPQRGVYSSKVNVGHNGNGNGNGNGRNGNYRSHSQPDPGTVTALMDSLEDDPR